MTNQVQYELGTHWQQAVIFIRFEKDANLHERVKKLENYR